MTEAQFNNVGDVQVHTIHLNCDSKQHVGKSFLDIIQEQAEQGPSHGMENQQLVDFRLLFTKARAETSYYKQP